MKTQFSDFVAPPFFAVVGFLLLLGVVQFFISKTEPPAAPDLADQSSLTLDELESLIDDEHYGPTIAVMRREAVVPSGNIIPFVPFDESLPPPPEPPPSVETPTECTHVATEAPVDPRPVVQVHTLRRDLKRVLCPRCVVFGDWHDKDGDTYPIRFDVHEYAEWADIPDDVLARNTGFPQFYWDGEKPEQHWKLGGWINADTFLRSYLQVMPHFQGFAPPAVPPKAGAVNGQTIAQLFNQYAGPGKFSFAPAKPIAAYIDDSTYLEYARITGTTKLVNGQPSLVLEEPLPVVSVKKIGVWWRAKLLGADTTLGPNPTVTIRTNRGPYVLKLEAAK